MNMIVWLVRFFRKGGFAYLKERREIMRRCLNTTHPEIANTATKLHLGCGSNVKEGWLNADLIDATSAPPDTINVVDRIFIMNATAEFPFRDNQFEFIYCEDFIEHFDQKDGLSIFAECYRVLRPGGVWRMSTPSFNRVVTFFGMKARKEINFANWQWGHQLIYSKEYMELIFGRCGFVNVEECRFGESKFNELRNLETRTEQKDWNLIMEATKPAR